MLSPELTGLLSEFAALAAKTNASEKRILELAHARDTEVRERLDHLRPLTASDDEAAKEYRTLTLERGKLAQVIGISEQRILPG